MSRRLPPFRAYLYVLATVNLVMAAICLLGSLVFNEGVNIVTVTLVLLVSNIAAAVSVHRNA